MCDFDYDYIDHCQYPVPATNEPEGYADCGDPAIAMVWFFRPDGEAEDSEMPVCARHLKKLHENDGDFKDVALEVVPDTENKEEKWVPDA
jgi:hypothetical protein